MNPLARAWFKASAPGSLMLLGEHAVLHGKYAVVCAVHRRIEVTLCPRPDHTVRLLSNLGDCAMDIDQLTARKEFRFVTAVIRLYRRRLPSGFDLRIRSQFSHKVGLGSSAAVTVAAAAAIRAWLGLKTAPKNLLRDAVGVIRAVQGLGSGADVAASVFGGIVLYRARSLDVRPLGKLYPITVLYSGSKKPTAEVVRIVERSRRRYPGLFRKIYNLMNMSSLQAAHAIRVGDWRRVGEIMNINQVLMEGIGVSNEKLSMMAYALCNDRRILGAKISGSGLGDCVIGLGRSKRRRWPQTELPVKLSLNGVRISHSR